ncbi:MAG: DNA photolyase family protein [Rhizobium sp.]|nr:DNA photolyase family protein [Rhizobium sp.]
MPQPQQPPSILWFRRDLRLADNVALDRAVKAGGPIICLYVREPGDPLAGANGAAQAWWLHHSLAALDTALRARGNRLVTMTGDPRHLLPWIVEQTAAGAVFWNRRYDGPGRETDTEIKATLKEKGVRAESASGFLLHDPMALKTQQGRHYSVYTPFWKAFEATYQPPAALPPPDAIPSGTFDLDGEALDAWGLLPTKPNWAAGFESLWQPGEDGARTSLGAFLRGALGGYAERRDFPGETHTSRLSPHLAFGEISPHAIWRSVSSLKDKMDQDDPTRFAKEIVWRDFAWHTLFHNPRLDSVNLDRRFDRFEWRPSEKDLLAWQRGETGYPVVDAGMRELWHTGTMHNRVRMIVASFLIKDLLIDWRAGERWFRDTLLDADAASNPFNWQWVAGCGADAAPFFRIFNPTLQGEKFDAKGDYVRRWCPELARLPNELIHRPFDAKPGVLERAGVRLADTYPRPIVDHAKARDAALAALKTTRQDVPED